MPLIKSRSKNALKKNIETEMKAHPEPEKRAQNIAIAYDVKRRASKRKKMAEGGEAIKKENYEAGMKIKKIDAPRMVEGSIADRIRKRKMMAEGGEVDIMENNEEMPNQFDEINEEALDYNPSDAMEDAHQPMDSNEHSDPAEERILDRSVVGAIRRKIKAKL